MPDKCFTERVYIQAIREAFEEGFSNACYLATADADKIVTVFRKEENAWEKSFAKWQAEGKG